MLTFIEKPGLAGKMGAESYRIASDKYDVRIVNKTIIDALELDATNV
jgi:hypothetical protein